MVCNFERRLCGGVMIDEWAGIQVDNAFVETNFVSCQSLKGHEWEADAAQERHTYEPEVRKT